MEATLTPARPLDKIDSERWQEIVDSEPFRRMMARIRNDYERAREACMRSDEDREVWRAQGAGKALASVLALPEVLAAEMRGNKRYLAPRSK